MNWKTSTGEFCLWFLPAAALFTAWLWSFPLFGPVLGSLAGKNSLDPWYLYLPWLAGHATGLLLCGLWGHRKKPSLIPRLPMQTGAILSGLGTLGFLITPASQQPFLAVGLGLVSAPFMAGYGVFLANCPDAYRGRVLALNLALGTALHIFFVSPYSDALRLEALTVIISVFPLLAAAGCRGLDRLSPRESSSGNAPSPVFWPAFIGLMAGFYAVAGFMYNLVYPRLVLPTEFSGMIGVLFYLPAAALGGILADIRERKVLIHMSLAAEGLGFILLAALSKNLHGQWLILGLMQFGFAWIDIFIWLILADMGARTARALPYLGFGLAINVSIIALASGASSYFGGPDFAATNYLPLLAAGLLFVLFPVAGILQETRLTFEKEWEAGVARDAAGAAGRGRKDPAGEQPAELPLFITKAGLTPREIEICLSLLAGSSLADIQSKLSISPNTIKTHLRNIYRKTGVSNQKEFLLRAWQEAIESSGRARLDIFPGAAPKRLPPNPKSTRNSPKYE